MYLFKALILIMCLGAHNIVFAAGTSCSDIFQDDVRELQNASFDIESAIKEGTLQRKLWALSRLGHANIFTEIELNISRRLRSESYSIIEQCLGGVGGGATLVRTESGLLAVVKDDTALNDIYGERAAYKMDRALALNVVPIVAIRGKGWSAKSIQLYIGAADESKGQINDKIRLLDYLLGITDRNPAHNVLNIDGTAMQVAIDNGSTFRATREKVPLELSISNKVLRKLASLDWIAGVKLRMV